MSKEYKINIFELLEKADLNNKNYYNNLTDEEKKQFSPFQIMRWFSGIDGHLSEYYLTSVNELLNVDNQLLAKHPELFWKLMSAIGIGRKQRHHWINPISKNKSSSNLYNFMYDAYPHAKDQEIDMMIKIITKDQLEDFLQRNAIDDDLIKKILKEFEIVQM